MNAFSRRPQGRPLRVVQCFRAPIGGLFRHVCDLTRGLAERGVEVGVMCDGRDADALSRRRLDELAAHAALGLHRRDMPRAPSPADVPATRALMRLAADTGADILHGHGAKGGAYARLAAALAGRRAVYTPHGGSLHYRPATPAGLAFLAAERVLGRLGAPILFESAYGRGVFARKVGSPPPGSKVVVNGLAPGEFEPVATAADACDVLYIGELRALKGPAVLLEALAAMSRRRPVTARFVGSGPDEAALKAAAAAAGLGAAVAFAEPSPARAAFATAKVVAVPSLAESLPYIVLEAGACGRPMVATNVGGIGEIFGPDADLLLPPGDAAALAAALEAALADPAAAQARALALRAVIRSKFSLAGMVDAVLATYRSLAGETAGAPAVPLARKG